MVRRLVLALAVVAVMTGALAAAPALTGEGAQLNAWCELRSPSQQVGES